MNDVFSTWQPDIMEYFIERGADVGEAYAQITVVHGEQDVDAVLELGRHVPNNTAGLGNRQP